MSARGTQAPLGVVGDVAFATAKRLIILLQRKGRVLTE
jgi:hypothetical protein